MSYTRFLRPLGFMLVMPIITTTCFAMQDSREASPLAETTIPVDVLQLVIRDTDFETKIKGWSPTCTEIHKFIFSGITQIPDKYMQSIDNLCISKFKNLTYINLEGNRFIDDLGLSNFLNLRKLNLSGVGYPNGNAICLKNNTLGQLTELRYLCMKGTSILSPLNITPLVNLTHLDVSTYPGSVMYPNWLSNNHLSHLTSLKILNIENCNGMQITDELKTILPNLEILR